MKGKPITPADVVALKTTDIPPEVFDAFNECIARKWDGRAATVLQDAVIANIEKRMPSTSRADIFANGWLDVEESYRAAGWHVEYDKPGYNESYPARFIFKRGPK